MESNSYGCDQSWKVHDVLTSQRRLKDASVRPDKYKKVRGKKRSVKLYFQKPVTEPGVAQNYRGAGGGVTTNKAMKDNTVSLGWGGQ